MGLKDWFIDSEPKKDSAQVPEAPPRATLPSVPAAMPVSFQQPTLSGTDPAIREQLLTSIAQLGKPLPTAMKAQRLGIE